MKLLFDENLSRHLVQSLADLFPGSLHVAHLSMLESSDTDIWNVGLSQAYVIVTKDADYYDRAMIVAAAPKIIWIRLPNCPTRHVESLLRMRYSHIVAFEHSVNDPVLALP